MSDQDVAVRPATTGDEAAVWPLARDFATSFVVEKAAFSATFAALVAEGGARTGPGPSLLLVAVDPSTDVAVGYLLAHAHRSFLGNGPLVWVEEVMVDEAWRRRGVGARLMAAAEDWARTHRAVYLSLASRRAGAFYLALGYEDSATFFKKTL